MKKYLFILIIITILACGDSGNNDNRDSTHLNSGTELIAPDTPATPVNVVEE